MSTWRVLWYLYVARGDSVSNCEYFKGTTRHYNDDDNVDFGSDIKGVANPIIVNIPAAEYEVMAYKVPLSTDGYSLFKLLLLRKGNVRRKFKIHLNVSQISIPFSCFNTYLSK